MIKRLIHEIIVHCSASGPKTKMEDIRKWHKQRGWKDIGYHYVIESDGQIRTARDINDVGAHCEGKNATTVGICLVGGNDGKKLHHFSKEQMTSLRILIDGLFMSYGRLPVVGHRKYAKKECPNFDVAQWMEDGSVKYLR